METLLIKTYKNNHARLYKESIVMLSPTDNREYGEKFLRYLDVSEKTIETYRKGLNSFFNFLTMNDVFIPTRETILNYKHYLKETNHKATTITAYVVAIRLFFKWTNQEDIYPNIADNVKGEKISTEHKKDYLSSNQIKNVLSLPDTTTIKGLRDYAILALMVTTGLRTIEIIRADIADIRTVGDETVLFIQGKGRTEKNDYVKLTSKVIEAIQQYLSVSNISENAPLFKSVSNNESRGKRLTTRSIRGLIKSYFLRAGYDSERLTAHSLRHTAGTLNLLNGGTLEETQQLLRHTKINTTMIYLHHLQRDKNKSEERIAEAVFN